MSVSEKTLWKILGVIFFTVAAFAYTSFLIFIPLILTIFIIGSGL